MKLGSIQMLQGTGERSRLIARRDESVFASLVITGQKINSQHTILIEVYCLILANNLAPPAFRGR